MSHVNVLEYLARGSCIHLWYLYLILMWHSKFNFSQLLKQKADRIHPVYDHNSFTEPFWWLLNLPADFLWIILYLHRFIYWEINWPFNHIKEYFMSFFYKMNLNDGYFYYSQVPIHESWSMKLFKLKSWRFEEFIDLGWISCNHYQYLSIIFIDFIVNIIANLFNIYSWLINYGSYECSKIASQFDRLIKFETQL